jgi:hypothetical protein
VKRSAQARCVVLLIASLPLFQACDKGQVAPSESAYRPKVVFVLFDLSASTEPKDTRDRYLQGFQKTVDGLQPGDWIAADAITDNPLARSTFPINEALIAPYNPLVDNPLTHQGKLKKQKEEIVAKAIEIVLHQKEKFTRTKILDSLLLAERVFRTYPREREALVLFSDMIEESEHYNFTQEPLTPQRIAAIISTEKGHQRLPDLKGVEVYVAGAASGTYRRMTSDRLQQIENFWREYFKACGAELRKERYGSALLEAPN